MKKFIISTILILVIILIFYIFEDIEVNESIASNNRFIKVLDQGEFEIYYDKETKVMYLQSCKGIVNQGYGGITVLVDKEGKPLIYE